MKNTGKLVVYSDKLLNLNGPGVIVDDICVTHECNRVVASGSYDAKPLHHSVLHQSLGVFFQGLDGDVLSAENTPK